jgi:hypothetical protein
MIDKNRPLASSASSNAEPGASDTEIELRAIHTVNHNGTTYKPGMIFRASPGHAQRLLELDGAQLATDPVFTPHRLGTYDANYNPVLN